jgi:hypothetical protein
MAPRNNKKTSTDDTLPSLDDLINKGTTTTSTTVPPSTGTTVPTTTTTVSVPSTTIPKTTTTTIPTPTTTVAPIATSGKDKTGTLSNKLKKDIAYEKNRLVQQNIGVDPTTAEKIATGEVKKGKSIWGKVTGFGGNILNYGLVKPIMFIDRVDNIVPALFEGGIKNAQVAAAGGEARYKTWAEIPRNKKTGVYIAKPGDLKLKKPEQYTQNNLDIDIPIDDKGTTRKLYELVMPTDVAIDISLSIGQKYGNTDKKKKYTKQSEIPVNIYTQQPIASVGDYKFTNEEALTKWDANRENPDGYILPSKVAEFLVETNQEVPGNKYVRSIINPSDVIERTADPKFGWGSITALQTGSKWPDRTIGLIGDVFGSVSTYATAGTGQAAKLGLTPLKEAGKATARDLAGEFIERAAESLARDGFTETIKIIEKEVAQELSQELGSRVVNRTAAAVVAEAGQLAVERATTEAAKKAAAKAAKSASAYWSSVGPRRVLGAASREATAIALKELRDEALQEAITKAGTAQGRLADNFVKAMTDDVIGEIASKGYSALNKKIVIDGVKTTPAKVLGIHGGLRFGVGTAKVIVPGTKYLQAPVGKAAYLGRKGLYTAGKAGKYIPKLEQPIGDLLTGLGRGGLPGSEEAIFSARTGLRSGRLKGAAAADALDLLAEDQVYRTLKKTTTSSLKPALDSIFKRNTDKAARATAYEILEIPLDELLVIFSKDINSSALDLSARLGRTVSTKEAALAKEVSQYLSELFRTVEEIAMGLGSRTTPFLKMSQKLAAGELKLFPQVLSDKAIGFLGRKHLGRKRVIDGIEYTVDELIEKTLVSLGHDARLIPSQSIINEIDEGTFWFGTRLEQADIDKGIAHLNQIAKDNLGVNFDILDTNVVSAVIKYSRKFADDYAFLERLQMVAGTKPSTRPGTPFGTPTAWAPTTPGGYSVANVLQTKQPFSTQSSVIAAVRDIGTSLAQYAVDPSSVTSAQLTNMLRRLDMTQVELDAMAADILSYITAPGRTRPFTTQDIANIVDDYVIRKHLDAWTDLDFENFSKEITGQIKDLEAVKAGTAELPARISFDEVDDRLASLFELQEITDALDAAKVAGDDVYLAWKSLRADLVDLYSAYFARSPKDVQKFMSKINPDQLKRMINVAEDTYIALDNLVIPDAAAKVEIAAMLNNVRKLKNPTYAGNFISVMQDVNRYIKTWATATPGFHTRNGLSNMFQWVAAGAQLNNIKDGIQMLNRWNKFVKENGYRPNLLADPSQLIDDFVNSSLVPPRLKASVRQTLSETGSVGFGDIEEVFGMTVPERTGVLGKEVPVREGAIGKAASEASIALGAIPRVSRKAGAGIENYSRFVLTFDGLQQGMSPLQAAARTNRFLFDYEDLSRLDEVAKSVVPFWIWMSRNLPLQMQEMWYNPKLYKQYQEFRTSLEDENGNNRLIPDYLEKSGAFRVAGNLFLKPDFGIPTIGEYKGTGSPSPLQEGVTDWRSIVSAIPAASIASTLFGINPRTGAKLRDSGEGFITPEIARTLLGQLGGPATAIGRGVEGVGALPGVPAIGANQDWGKLEVLREVLGIPGATYPSGYARENTPQEAQLRALYSYLGIPFTTVGPDQEISALYDQIRRLQEYEK